MREVLTEIPSFEKLSSYYETIGQPWNPILDEVIEIHDALKDKEKAFWESYSDKVNDALQNEFYVKTRKQTLITNCLLNVIPDWFS